MWEILVKIVEYLLESFKNSPATLVLLLIVIYQFWTQEKKDDKKEQFIVQLINGQLQDAERQSRMITLLEVLVGRRIK